MENAEKLLHENVNLVYFVVRRQFSSLAGDQDLIQEGLIGLWKACLRYDGREGVTFSSFAIPCIRNAILMELRKRRRGPDTVSIDTSFGDGDNDFSLADTLVDRKSSAFEDDVFVEEFIQHLSAPDRRIMTLRCKGLTQKAIGSTVGISQTMVSRRLTRIGTLYGRLRTGEGSEEVGA